MMPIGLTRLELDALSCSTPGCDHVAHDGLYLVAACHARSGVEVEYRAGTVTLTCKICRKVVTRIAVQE